MKTRLEDVAFWLLIIVCFGAGLVSLAHEWGLM
jgi:hypothetical protein